tara:strand:+ start:63695 stop:64279 length:585 start_codon:yes stop_codon:yes gene_type:complete
VRSIILGALGAIVAIVFVKLVFDSQGSQAVAVEEAELKKAIGEYNRTAARETRDVEAPRATTTIRRPKAKTETGASSETSKARTTQTREPYVAPEPADHERDEPDDEVEVKSRMDDANRLYDRADYEGARDAAIELLSSEPDNVRMKRIVVSSSCIMGDAEEATKHFSDLPSRDQRQMARRCQRYGIEFEDQDE